MSDAVITVENLSKRYLLGHRSGEQGVTLREVVGREPALLDPGPERAVVHDDVVSHRLEVGGHPLRLPGA